MPVVSPLNDRILYAISAAVDDAQVESKREPTHGDLDFIFARCKVQEGDPKALGQTVGKAKRVRSVLGWTLSNNIGAGRACVDQLLAIISARGGFRAGSPNFVGREAIVALKDAYSSEGYILHDNGNLSAKVLDSLSGQELTTALRAYVRRAQTGAEDAALLTGTSKDLLEATAAHVLRELHGIEHPPQNFQTLLGQAFVYLGLKTTADKELPTDTPSHRLQRHLFGAACAINTLRNKQGTGHGRPWLPTVTQSEAHAAIQTMGIVAQLLLDAINARK